MWEVHLWKELQPHFLLTATPVWALEYFSVLREFYHVLNILLSFVGVKGFS